MNINNNTNNTNRPQRIHQPLTTRRVTRLAITQQENLLRENAGSVYAPLISQAYRAIQNSHIRLLSPEVMSHLLRRSDKNKTRFLQILSLVNSPEEFRNFKSAYNALSVYMPHETLSENHMNTLLRTPPEHRIIELEIITLGLDMPEHFKPQLRNLYYQILSQPNNSLLDTPPIQQLLEYPIETRFIALEHLLRTLQGPAPVA